MAVYKKASFYLLWIASHRRALPSEVIKMLIDSPVWGPSYVCCLSFSLIVCNTASLQKYNHVSYHRHQLNWLSLPSLIKYHSLCVMHKIHYGTNVPLNPPITFGSSHTYSTRWSDRFIQPVYCQMSTTPNLFRHVTSTTFLSVVYDYFLTRE